MRRQLQCPPSVHVDSTNGIATLEVAEALPRHLIVKVGQCKADFATVGCIDASNINSLPGKLSVPR